jgi:hypothetical protein
MVYKFYFTNRKRTTNNIATKGNIMMKKFQKKSVNGSKKSGNGKKSEFSGESGTIYVPYE